MAERLFGIETEYALTALDAGGKPVDRDTVLAQLMRLARGRLPHLPDTTGRGVFLANGARFYIDVPDHPEFTTPECANPWDAVRYVQAGERILAGLATDLRGRRVNEVVILRSNVDYSGTGSTWGTHESYQHRSPPSDLPEQIIPHLASRIIYTGAGGFDSRLLHGIEFTLSPRVSHLETKISGESMHSRGIFHTKDETLSAEGYHRLHILCGESVCSEIGAWLKIGTTALVVALIDAGLRPGDAVQLRSPLRAMRCFAGDPTCRATAPSVTGVSLTALDIQRHYLEMAEAHLQAPSMPPWAERVCSAWRDILGALETAPESVATTVDWAIKLALFKRRVAQRGIAWESLPQWNHVATKLGDALQRASITDQRLSVDVILNERGPVAEEVRRLTPYLHTHGLQWDALRAFIELRQELFEIDTRFGQLGETGIFSCLENAGVLTHRVDGVDNIEHAMEHPPDFGRAGVRGRWVRELSGAGKRYESDWYGIWDRQKHRLLDLSDPFSTSAQWQAYNGGDYARGRETSDSSRRTAALEAYQAGEYAHAERLLCSLIAHRFEIPSTHCHRARICLIQDRLQDAATEIVAAWEHRAEGPRYVVGRILWLQLALHYTWASEETRLIGFCSPQVILGRLKTVLAHEDSDMEWAMDPVLEHLQPRLPAEQHALLAALVAALCDASNLPALDQLPTWRNARAQPVE